MNKLNASLSNLNAEMNFDNGAQIHGRSAPSAMTLNNNAWTGAKAAAD